MADGLMPVIGPVSNRLLVWRHDVVVDARLLDREVRVVVVVVVVVIVVVNVVVNVRLGLLLQHLKRGMPIMLMRSWKPPELPRRPCFAMTINKA
ncbi:hypothetical protein ElyMa_000251200 [Elysia marginata]|uniref:Uncharacterized protein n=1 Tax=Elysia marginata TaxID=1093978 RepID=A0AAV4F2R5_9GAST|nr:hypothetical protein ElyMa_000251200 [Elysia marginata]